MAAALRNAARGLRIGARGLGLGISGRGLQRTQAMAAEEGGRRLQQAPALAAEEGWPRLSPRFLHGGPPASARPSAASPSIHVPTRRFASSRHGEPNPITFKEKVKIIIQTFELLNQIMTLFFKLVFTGLVITLLYNDLTGPRHVPWIIRLLLADAETIREMARDDDKEGDDKSH